MAQQPAALAGTTWPMQETSQTSSMQLAIGHELPAMLQLPSELLQQIWKHLAIPSYKLDKLYNHTGPPQQQHQHALYSSCKAVRDITTSFITGMRLVMDMRHCSPEAALEEGMDVMARFPRHANLKSLAIKMELPTTEGDLTCLLPGFMFKAAMRLHAVEKLDLYNTEGVFTCGDIGSIAGACPNLQELTLKMFSARTPLFKPLAQLARLRKVSLESLAPSEDLMVMQSLGTLSQIEVLSIGRSLKDSVCLEHVLPHLHGLASLRSLSLHACLGGVKEAMQLFSCLQHLEHLTALRWHAEDLSVTLATGHDVGALGRLTQLVSLGLGGVTLHTPAVRTLLALPNLEELEAVSLVVTPQQSQSDGEDMFLSYLKKWVLTECSSLQRPFRELFLDSIEWIEAPDTAGFKPEFVRAVSELIAQIWTPAIDDRSVTLKSGSANAQLSVALIPALKPLLDIEDLKLYLDGWRLDAANVHAMLDTRSVPEDLEIRHCHITDLGFAALFSAAGLRYLTLCKHSVVPDARVIVGLLLGRWFAGLQLHVQWDGQPKEVKQCMTQLNANARSMGTSYVISVQGSQRRA